MKGNNRSEEIFILTIATVAITIGLLRRAYTISVQFGYKFWSFETWSELRIYLALTTILIAIAIFRYQRK
jgi:hypothetical protein